MNRPGIRRLPVRNPRSGKNDYEIQSCSADEIAELAESMRLSQQAWRAGGLKFRIEILNRWVEALKRSEKDIVAALSIDTGRRSISGQEFHGMLAGIARWCGLAPVLMEVEPRRSAVFSHINLETRLVPYSLVGVISPWNFPLTLSFIDTIPALLAGAAVIIKPSEVTPRFVEPLIDSLEEVPELQQVLGFAMGDGSTGAALIEAVDAIAFTGSVATGRKVGQAAAAAFIPSFLELGGKDPALVLADADVERATSALLRGSVVATGQACQSIERIYVHQSLHDRFVDRLREKARAVGLTDDESAGGILGPLIFARQADTIQAHLDDAVAQGAKIVTGGEIKELGGGLWLEPTVLTGVTHEMLVMTDESFGPVMPVMSFDSVDEAIELANDTVFGLSGCVFSADLDQARAVAERINAGGISINDAALTAMVFEIEKSSFKSSGLGASRMGPTGLLRFLRRKALYVNEGEVLGIEAFNESV